jgi:hypothetical protein
LCVPVFVRGGVREHDRASPGADAHARRRAWLCPIACVPDRWSAKKGSALASQRRGEGRATICAVAAARPGGVGGHPPARRVVRVWVLTAVGQGSARRCAVRTCRVRWAAAVRERSACSCAHGCVFEGDRGDVLVPMRCVHGTRACVKDRAVASDSPCDVVSGATAPRCPAARLSRDGPRRG